MADQSVTKVETHCSSLYTSNLNRPVPVRALNQIRLNYLCWASDKSLSMNHYMKIMSKNDVKVIIFLNFSVH